jgi:hypothetical protein
MTVIGVTPVVGVPLEVLRISQRTGNSLVDDC